MTSPTRYTSTLRVYTGNTGKHLSEGDDVTGNSVTSPRNSLSLATPLVSSPLSPGQSRVVFSVSTPDVGDNAHRLINGRRPKSVPTSGEYNENYVHPNEQRDQHLQQHQQQTVISKTRRAVSVPATQRNDLESSRPRSEGEGHQLRFSNDVITLTLFQPTRKLCLNVHCALSPSSSSSSTP